MEKSTSPYEHFIVWMTDRLGPEPKKKDNGRIARLKRGDNPDLAPQAWEILFRLGIKENDFLPCLTVGAAMCRLGEAGDGTASLGRALASCCGDTEQDKEQGSLRLRRLLACSDIREVCAVIRPVLAFIASKGRLRLCHARLLDDLTAFRSPQRREAVKMRWTRDFWISEQTEIGQSGGGGA